MSTPVRGLVSWGPISSLDDEVNSASLYMGLKVRFALSLRQILRQVEANMGPKRP